MADIYTRFRDEGDYYDITGTQPPTAFADAAPVAQQAVYQQGNGIPTTRRVLDVGRNDYNMQGTLEAAQRYGIPPVMVQSSPYARTAYTYGPSGPIPLIGATSVYPHVVSSGRYDYGAPYMAQAFAMPDDGYSFSQLMADVKELARMRMRARMAGGGGGGAASNKAGGAAQQTPQDDTVALPPEGAIGITVPQMELPKPVAQEQGERWLDARRSAELKANTRTPYIKFGQDNQFLLNEEMDYVPPTERRGRSLSMTPERATEYMSGAMTPASRSGVYVTPPRFSVDTPQERMRRRLQQAQTLADAVPTPPLPQVAPLQGPLVANDLAVPQRSPLPPTIMVMPEVR